jgi:hypothetical protein
MRKLGYFQHKEERLLPSSGGESTSGIRRIDYLQHEDDRLFPASAG